MPRLWAGPTSRLATGEPCGDSGPWSTPGCYWTNEYWQKTPEKREREGRRNERENEIWSFECFSCHTLSFFSQRNLSFWVLLCMKTPSSCPFSTALISMALLPQPITWESPIRAEYTETSIVKKTACYDIIIMGLPMEEGISPHWSLVSLMGPPVEFTYTPSSVK